MRFNKIFWLLFFIFVVFVKSAFCINYLNSENVFDVKVVGVYEQDNNYYVKVGIETYVEHVDFDFETIYREENLIAGEKSFTCKGSCEIDVPIKKVFFDKYKLLVSGEYNGKYYEDKTYFSIDLKKPKLELNLNKEIYIENSSKINFSGIIDGHSGENVTYTFEVFPKSQMDLRQYFEKNCSGRCEFSFALEPPLLLDEYQVNVYSKIGEVYDTFRIKTKLEGVKEETIEKSKIDEIETCRDNDTNNHNCRSIEELDFRDRGMLNLFDALNLNSLNPNEFIYNGAIYGKQKKNKEELRFRRNNQDISILNISSTDFVDVDIMIKEKNVKKISVKNTSVSDLSVGFEYVESKNIEKKYKNKGINNVKGAFAINPGFSENVNSYNLTFLATGTSLLKCEDYDFFSQNCYGDFVKILDTVPGKEYTVTLTPKDPLFVEIFNPKFIVQRGVASANQQVISASINPVVTNESFILFTANTNDNTPDDWQFTPDFGSPSSLEFTRYDGSRQSSDISWEVIESDLFYVQRGTQTLPSGSAITSVAINGVNLSESFVIVYGRCADETDSDSHAGFFLGELTNSTNLYLERGNAGKCAATVSWQVVQWEGAKVQSGASSFDSSATSITASITDVNLSNSLLFFGTSSIGTDPGMNTNFIRGDFSSVRNINFVRTGSDGASNRNIYWYVVEDEFLTVQRGYNSFSSDTTQTITTLFNSSKSFYVSSCDNSGGGQQYRNALYTLQLQDASTLAFDKQTTAQTAGVNWFVAEFKVPEPESEVSLTSSSGNNYTTDDLICSYELGDDANFALVNWLKNGYSITRLNMPFDGNSSNALLDFSFYSNDASKYGDVYWDSTGGQDNYGTFVFDGTNDWLEIPDDNSLDSNLEQLSVEAWVYDEGDNNNRGIVSKRVDASTGISYSLYSGPSGYLYFNIGTDSDTSNIALSNNVWHHVVATFDGTADSSTRKRIYIDGSNVGTGEYSGTTIPNTNSDLFIGILNANYGNSWQGKIADVKIYNETLSAEQVTTLYQKNINVLKPTMTRANDTWQCSVRPFNSDNYGNNYFSNSLTVLSEPLPPQPNTSMRTCSDTFGFFCGTWPDTSEGDNTFDSCPSGAGNDENVIEVYINSTQVYVLSEVEVTCEFDPYSSGNEEYIYYYNGTGWKELFNGNAPGSANHNVTVSTAIDNITGTQWFRCIIDWNGENDECANAGSYYDNDDANISVIPLPPVGLEIISPENKTYNTQVIPLEFLAGELSDITYSIDGEPYVSACYNCTHFNDSVLLRDGSHILEVRAVNVETSLLLNDSVAFSIDTNVTIEPRNSSMRTCSDTFGFFCGNWPYFNEEDNTFDSCPSGAGDDENVVEVYINGTLLYVNDSVEVTCEFDPYSNGNEEYIYYYNGVSWTQLYNGNAPDGNIHNVSATTTVYDFVGTQYFRCIIDWDGENDSCANSGSWYDNDDASFNVTKPIVVPFLLSILSPLNTTYNYTTIPYDFLTTKFANISYSLDGAPYSSACSNCTSYFQNHTLASGGHILFVQAIDLETNQIATENVSFYIQLVSTGDFYNLQLFKNITRLSDNLYLVYIDVRNLANVTTPKNKSVNVYSFLPDLFNVTSNFSYSSSIFYSSSVSYGNISAYGKNGTIYEFEISGTNPSNASLDEFWGVRNSDNSWYVMFNVSGFDVFEYKDLFMVGLDPK